MANSRLTSLTAITTPASGDKIYIVDISDTTDGASGSSRQITYTNLIAGILTELGVTSSVTELNVLDGIPVTLTATELGYVDGVTSAIQTQLNTKAPSASPTFTGTVILPKTLEIQDTSGDHQYVLAVSELVADRTITLPLLTASDTFVFAAFAQTLTNKTLTSPSMTSPSVTSGDLGLATGLNIQVNGSDPKRGIYVPASAMYPSTTAGCAALTQVESSTNDVNIKVLDFDGAGSSKESAEFGIQSPSYWDAGTVTAQFIWYATAGSGTVNWECQGVAFSDDDALDTAYGTLQEVTDTLLATGDVHITAETPAITIAGSPVAGDWVQFKIARDPANDTNSSDARLLGIRIRFGIKQYDDQ